jgi:hypothetical protein
MTLSINGNLMTVSEISRENILNNLPEGKLIQLEITGQTAIYDDDLKQIVTIYDLK